MEVKAENYRVWYDDSETKVFFEGSLRLNGVTEYEPIVKLLDDVLEKNPEAIKWDLKSLAFLNSSGINALYKFIIGVRKKGDVTMQVFGSKTIPWQQKSLPNMKKFLKSLELILD